MSENLTFVELIEEDDGSTTLVAGDASGALHEFRGVVFTGVQDGGGAETASIPMGED